MVLAVSFAAEPIPITLDEARFRALVNNPSLVQAELDVKAARWGMLGAVAGALPKVNFISSVIRSDESTVDRQNIMRDVILMEYGQYIDPKDFPPFAYKDMYSSHISVDQPIYNGGIELTALRIAGTRKKLIHLSSEIQQKELILAVETAYYNLCRAYQAQKVQQDALGVTRGYLERFRRQESLGMISSVDVLRWEVRESDAETALIDADNNLRLSELALEQVMGLFDNVSYYPADLPLFMSGDYTNPAEGLEPPDILWERMKESSLDLKVSENSVKLEKHNIWIASSNAQPKLNFNYTYSWQADDDYQLDGFESWTAAITLNIPLFASFGNVAKVQEARINAKIAREGARDFETLLYMRLTTAYNTLFAASARFNSALKMRQQADEVLSAQEKRYELGMITTLDLMDARTVNLTAELGVINARFDALIARAQLDKLTGKAADTN